jgi:hypothetical protein
MIPAHLSRVARTAGVALLPAVVVLCCAGRATAECGDYLRIIGSDGAVQPAGHHQSPADRPCQGPYCSGAPTLPAPVPPAPTSLVPDLKGLVTFAGGDPDNAALTRFETEPDGTPVRQPRSIFHPPRAS